MTLMVETGYLRTKLSRQLAELSLESSRGDRFSGEPFPIRDIKLHKPKVRIGASSSRNIFNNFRLLAVLIWTATDERYCPVKGRHTLEKADKCPSFHELQEQRSSDRIAFLENHEAAPCRIRPPQKNAQKHLRCQSRRHEGSELET